MTMCRSDILVLLSPPLVCRIRHWNACNVRNGTRDRLLKRGHYHADPLGIRRTFLTTRTSTDDLTLDDRLRDTLREDI